MNCLISAFVGWNSKERIRVAMMTFISIKPGYIGIRESFNKKRRQTYPIASQYSSSGHHRRWKRQPKVREEVEK